MPSEHQKETAFLRRCILYEEGNEGRRLDERIAQIQRDERSLRRATWLISLVTALVLAGFGYMAFLIEDFPNHLSLFAAEFTSKVVCALGIGSLTSLIAFAWLGLGYRRELNLRREECRQLVTTLLESHLGKLPSPRRKGETIKPQNPETPETASPASDNKPAPVLSARTAKVFPNN